MHQLFAVLVALILALGIPGLVLPAQAQTTTFEAEALGKALEVYGLMEPSVGSLRLEYEVHEGGRVTIRIVGRRPGLQDIQDHHLLAFRRLLCIIAGGQSHVTLRQVQETHSRFTFGMAVFEDRRAHGTEAAARRFGITPQRIEEVIESNYFGLYNAQCNVPLPAPPRGTQSPSQHI